MVYNGLISVFSFMKYSKLNLASTLSRVCMLYLSCPQIKRMRERDRTHQGLSEVGV